MNNLWMRLPAVLFCWIVIVVFLLKQEQANKRPGCWLAGFWMLYCAFGLLALTAADRIWITAGYFAGCGLAFMQDFLHYRFEKTWLLPAACGAAGLFCLSPVPLISRLLSLGYVLVLLIFYFRHACGSTDIWCAAWMGLVLGTERMTICILIACLCGLLIQYVRRLCRIRQPMIPFVSCLCIGFMAALLRGWTLFDRFFGLIGF